MEQMVIEEVKEEVKQDPKWVKYIKQRIARNKNFLCAVTGPTGSGKSWATLSICEMLDPEFNISRVVFSAKDLMYLINYGGLKSGSCIMWDETQIDLSSRNWQSTLNKVLNYLISTFRHRNFILFFTAPYLDFIDSSTLKMFHANFETVKIDRRKNKVILKPKQLDYNQNQKKWYTPYLQSRGTGFGNVKVKRWGVPKPSREGLIEAYENKKLDFTTHLNKDIEQRLEQIGFDGELKKTLTEIQEEYVLARQEHPDWTQRQIAKYLDKDDSQISRMEAAIKKKGIDWKTYKK